MYDDLIMLDFLSKIIVLSRLLLEEYVSCSNELTSDRISALNLRIQSTVRQFESR